MQKRTLGKSGPEVSVVGLGCNNFGALDLERSRAVVHRALDAGITLIDTADLYNDGASEDCLGQVLGERRKDVVLATKFGLLGDSQGRPAGASFKYFSTCATRWSPSANSTQRYSKSSARSLKGWKRPASMKNTAGG